LELLWSWTSSLLLFGGATADVIRLVRSTVSHRGQVTYVSQCNLFAFFSIHCSQRPTSNKNDTTCLITRPLSSDTEITKALRQDLLQNLAAGLLRSHARQSRYHHVLLGIPHDQACVTSAQTLNIHGNFSRRLHSHNRPQLSHHFINNTLLPHLPQHRRRRIATHPPVAQTASDNNITTRHGFQRGRRTGRRTAQGQFITRRIHDFSK
jgi:hypothetical protein